MDVRYDFDILPGKGPDGPGPVAAFRDPRAAEALRGAAPSLRAVFEAAGFGYGTHDSGAPLARFPARDVAARTRVVERLAAGLERIDIGGAALNGFDVGAFLDVAALAQPIGEPVRLDPDAPPYAPKLDYDPWAEPKRGTPVGAGGLPGGGLLGFEADRDSALDRAGLRAEVRSEMRGGGIVGLINSPTKAFGGLALFVALIYLLRA